MNSFIIAEIGINHGGDFEKAKRMIEAAAMCGANAIKFQTFWGLKGLEKYEFLKEQWAALKNFAEELAVEFMTSLHWESSLAKNKNEDYKAINFVDTLVKRHKIASPYLTNKKYVQHIAKKGKPILLSTGSVKNKNGMAKMSEIKTALTWLKNCDVALLHCVSKYPCKNQHLERIKKLKAFGRPVGLSDHSLEKDVKSWPVVEKHFKLDDDCIDAKVSLSPTEFAEMVKHIRNYQSIFNDL